MGQLCKKKRKIGENKEKHEQNKFVGNWKKSLGQAEVKQAEGQATSFYACQIGLLCISAFLFITLSFSLSLSLSSYRCLWLIITLSFSLSLSLSHFRFLFLLIPLSSLAPHPSLFLLILLSFSSSFLFLLILLSFSSYLALSPHPHYFSLSLPLLLLIPIFLSRFPSFSNYHSFFFLVFISLFLSLSPYHSLSLSPNSSLYPTSVIFCSFRYFLSYHYNLSRFPQNLILYFTQAFSSPPFLFIRLPYAHIFTLFSFSNSIITAFFKITTHLSSPFPHSSLILFRQHYQAIYILLLRNEGDIQQQKSTCLSSNCSHQKFRQDLFGPIL